VSLTFVFKSLAHVPLYVHSHGHPLMTRITVRHADSVHACLHYRLWPEEVQGFSNRCPLC